MITPLTFRRYPWGASFYEYHLFSRAEPYLGYYVAGWQNGAGESIPDPNEQSAGVDGVMVPITNTDSIPIPIVKDCSSLDVDIIVRSGSNSGEKAVGDPPSGNEDTPAAAGWYDASPEGRFFKGPREFPSTTAEGTVVQLVAKERSGYRFVGWQGKGTIYTSGRAKTPGKEDWVVDTFSAKTFEPDKTLSDKLIFVKMGESKNFEAVFARDKIYVVVLSGEQAGHTNADDIDISQNAYGTCNDWPASPAVSPPSNAVSGLFRWANEVKTHDEAGLFEFDLRNEDDVMGVDDIDINPYPQGIGPLFFDLWDKITAGEISRLIIVGHSHGGGSVYDLCKALNDAVAAGKAGVEYPLVRYIRFGLPLVGDFRIQKPFEIVLTAYVDAVRNDSYTQHCPEYRVPPLSKKHFVCWTDNASKFGYHNTLLPSSINDINQDHLIDTCETSAIGGYSECVEVYGHVPAIEGQALVDFRMACFHGVDTSFNGGGVPIIKLPPNGYAGETHHVYHGNIDYCKVTHNALTAELRASMGAPSIFLSDWSEPDDNCIPDYHISNDCWSDTPWTRQPISDCDTDGFANSLMNLWAWL